MLFYEGCIRDRSLLGHVWLADFLYLRMTEGQANACASTLALQREVFVDLRGLEGQLAGLGSLPADSGVDPGVLSAIDQSESDTCYERTIEQRQKYAGQDLIAPDQKGYVLRTDHGHHGKPDSGQTWGQQAPPYPHLILRIPAEVDDDSNAGEKHQEDQRISSDPFENAEQGRSIYSGNCQYRDEDQSDKTRGK